MGTVRVEDRDGGVRVLTLDRPPAHALDATLLDDLGTAARDAAADDAVRAVVVTGAGTFFSAGFDLRASRDPVGEQRVQQLYHDTHLALLRLPKPTIAMVNGHTIAGGVVIALACDYRLGVEGDWKLGLNEVAIGASYPKVAIEIVKLRLQHARATELALGAALYPASQAVRLGVVDELLPPDTFAETVLRRAARMAGFPREAYADTKAEIIAEAVARVESESPETATRRMAIWRSEESHAARQAQRKKLEHR